MTYYLFKLRFTAPVHFGDSLSAASLPGSEMTFCADRLFSALCVAMAKADPAAPRRLCEQAQRGLLKLSDAFPWKDGELYLPRPCLEAAARRDSDASRRKAMKKLAYLPLTQYGAFLRSLSGGTEIDIGSLQASFGQERVQMCAAVQDGKDALPYAVGQFCFAPGCGLYFLLGAQEPALFEQLCRAVRLLGRSGIGGKISSGCGSFEVVQAVSVRALDAAHGKWLERHLTGKDADTWISLTTALPKDDELDAALDGALFQPVRRGGFVQSAGANGSHKKQEQFFLKAGSTFRRPFAGDVYDVAPQGCAHPVYRYAMPIFLGVKKC